MTTRVKRSLPVCCPFFRHLQKARRITVWGWHGGWWIAEPADCTRHSKPFLANVFRNGISQDGAGFRFAGRLAHASRASRLARDAIHGQRMEHQGAAED